MKMPEGNAIVYCQGAFNTTNGKTAHGLVRFTRRYRVIAVVDKKYAGQDAGEVLDGRTKNIPVVQSVDEALKLAENHKIRVSHMVIGIAPDGGRLSDQARADVKYAITKGLHIDAGLHDFLTEDAQIVELAKQHKIHLRDVRKTPGRESLHFFTGKIEEVDCLKIALLGTDSAIGKRTTAWRLVEDLESKGYKAEMVGTGQTAWMQGAKYGIIMDSLINDFVSGEIEQAVWSAWKHENPDVIVIEGQGSLMNPAYPGGFEILAAGRPDMVILQHAPMRLEYDGFPGYKIHALEEQIKAVELISGKPVVAITINHENMDDNQIAAAKKQIEKETGLPACDPLKENMDAVIKKIVAAIPK